VKPSEHLEKVFSDAYKREIDQDESVWRTLPFFATSLTLYAALLGYIGGKLPEISLNAFLLAGYLLMAASAAFLATSLVWLWFSVHTRVYRQIPMETDVLAFSISLRDFHSQMGLEGDTLDNKVVEEIQDFIAKQYAEATTHNRRVNEGRFRSRSYSIRFLMFGYVTLGVLSLSVFAADKLLPIAHATFRH
jgi:hypothetical protein